MFAVQIFCPNLNIREHEDIINSQILTKKEKDIFKRNFINLYIFLEYLYDDFNMDINFYKKYSNLINEMEKNWDFALFPPLLSGDWTKPLPPGNSLIGLSDLFKIVNGNIDISFLYKQLETYEHRKKARYYATLKEYIKAGYSKDEIKQIFKAWDIEIPENDFKFYNERWYLLKNIFIDNFKNHIQSDTYTKFIKSFCD